MSSAADFDGFVARCSPGLLRLARRLAADDAAGEDLLQSALATTWARWRRLRDTSDRAAEAYVARVLVSKATRSRRRMWMGERPTAELPERLTQTDGVDERLALRAALADLPPRWRAVIVLRYAEDRSEKETAELLGCSPGTVKSSAARALARLREVPALADLVHPVPEETR